MATVFVSHRRSDASEAEALANDIRSAGHQVWLDDWEISIGDSIVAKMNEGLGDSAYLVLCYSKAGSEAPWIGREWQSALARQMNGLSVKILPVILTGGSPPAILADIQYVDLTKDRSAAVKSLLKAIR